MRWRAQPPDGLKRRLGDSVVAWPRRGEKPDVSRPPHHHHIQHGVGEERRGVLRDVADLAPDPHRTVRGGQDPHHTLEQRRLPPSIGAEDREDRTGFEAEGVVPKDLRPYAVAKPNARKLNHRSTLRLRPLEQIPKDRCADNGGDDPQGDLRRRRRARDVVDPQGVDPPDQRRGGQQAPVIRPHHHARDMRHDQPDPTNDPRRRDGGRGHHRLPP